MGSDYDSDWFIQVSIRIPIDGRGIIACFRNNRDDLVIISTKFSWIGDVESKVCMTSSTISEAIIYNQMKLGNPDSNNIFLVYYLFNYLA